MTNASPRRDAVVFPSWRAVRFNRRCAVGLPGVANPSESGHRPALETADPAKTGSRAFMGEANMTRSIRALMTAFCILFGLGLADTAQAQKRGGILTMFSSDSPGGLSVLEEATVFSLGPLAGLFNNLALLHHPPNHKPLKCVVP